MNDIQEIIQVFLDKHFPNRIESVERLDGGMMNYTYRFYFKDEPVSRSIDRLETSLNPSSLIMKIAFPSMSCDVNMTFPISRQEFEEKALNLFTNEQSEWSWNMSLVLRRNPCINIPHVWFREATKHVLIMDDCGHLPTLSQWLCTRDASSTFSSVRTHQYGEQLATFLLDMQISSRLSIYELQEHFHNEEVEQSILTHFVRTIGRSLDLSAITDADELAQAAVDHFEYYFSRTNNDVKVFAHGDLSPSAILINDTRANLSIIDWEFASTLSPAWDLAFLLSYFHSEVLIQPLHSFSLAFVHAFIDTYRQRARQRDVNWYHQKREQYLFAWSLGIIHGTLLINRATAIKWCSCEKKDCFHVCTILRLGADYLRRCRSGADSMTYTNMLKDPFLGRFFSFSVVN